MVFRIELPPLCERLCGLEGYVRAFVKMFGLELGKRIEEITLEYMQALKRYSWKGDICELRNVIERSIIISDSGRLSITDLPFEIQQIAVAEDGEKSIFGVRSG